MGNENGKLKDLEIDRTPVECTAYWSLCNALASTTANEDGKQFVSIFQGKSLSPDSSSWTLRESHPLQRATKNLMIYRHPYILKFISTWESGGQRYLATERVKPLHSVLIHQSDIQMCLGLRTILCSLIFLIEKAMARHLNICLQSIYVNDSGSWRLGGFEYVWKSNEVNEELLCVLKPCRNRNALEFPDRKKRSNEEEGESDKETEPLTGIEQYAFATLCEELLSSRSHRKVSSTNSQIIPYVDDFREYCRIHLKHSKHELRPQLSAVLLHPYFNHEFVLIHAFLFELPLKGSNERQDFFTGLIDRLRYFDEYMVAVQFGGDLLSRMVLLDPTAQLCVTPYVLRTRNDHSPALFTATTYRKCILPHILRMFRLRDAQIRLILLEYFSEFIHLLTREQLEVQILPHLLAGMHDTNDVLVAKTLRSLADLIPILGSTLVLGNEQRTRLFSDGRPQAAISDTIKHWIEPRSITPVLGETGECQMVSASPLPSTVLAATGTHSSLSSSRSNSLLSLTKYDDQRRTFVEHHHSTFSHAPMPPRLSPDGGEDVSPHHINLPEESGNATVAAQELCSASGESTVSGKESINNDGDGDDNWLDWDAAEEETPTTDIKEEKEFSRTSELENDGGINSLSMDIKQQTHSPSVKQQPPKIDEDDLSKLDIQIQSVSLADRRRSLNMEKTEETGIIDFFKDMEPKIVTTGLSLSFDHCDKNSMVVNADRFAANQQDAEVEMVMLDGGGHGWMTDEEEVDLQAVLSASTNTLDNTETLLTGDAT